MAKHVIRGYRTQTLIVEESRSTWIVARSAAFETVNPAIYESDDYHGNTFRVNGSISVGSGMSGLALAGVDSRVFVGTSGVFNGASISMSGDRAAVENRGRISVADDHSAVALSGPHATFDNFGKVEGTVFTNNDIFNHKGGVIRGGNVDFGDGAVSPKLVNEGRILGAVLGGAGGETIVNRGVMAASVVMGDGADRFVGAGGETRGSIDGGGGDDIIDLRHATVRAGDPLGAFVTGGMGNDTLDLRHAKIGSGIAVQGSAGDDTYLIDKTLILSEFAGEGTDTVKSSVSHELRANIENLTLTGAKNAAALGNEARNILTGNPGDNLMRGRAGADDLYGGRGDDRLFGGADADIFVFKTGYGRDTIMDFSQADHDFIAVNQWKAIADFDDLMNNHASDHGGDVWIAAGNDRLIIKNIQKNELDVNDFYI